MVRRHASPDELAELGARLDAWLSDQLDQNPAVADVTRDDELPYRWFVRLVGEEKDFTTIWMTIGQRTLRYETYFMPAPEENHRALHDLLMRRNHTMVGVRFGIGDEDAVYLSGSLPLHAVDEDELDRIVGTVYEHVERNFRAAMRIGFASRFRR